MKCLIKVPNREYDMSNWFIEKTKKSIYEQVEQLYIIDEIENGSEKERLYGSCITTLQYLCNMFCFMNGVEINNKVIEDIITEKYYGLEKFEVYCGIKDNTQKELNYINFMKFNNQVKELMCTEDRSNRTLIYEIIYKNREQLYFCKKEINKIEKLLDYVTNNNMKWEIAIDLINKVLVDIKGDII